MPYWILLSLNHLSSDCLGSDYSEHPLPPLSRPLWSLSAVFKSLGVLPSNTDFMSSALITLSLASSRFHRLMFLVIVLPVRNCLQDGAEEMEQWPAAIQICVFNCLLLPTNLAVPQAPPKQHGQNWTQGLPISSPTNLFLPDWWPKQLSNEKSRAHPPHLSVL